ncbi:Type I restriction modification DNA specificity domain protein [anaerobic digester metagenome]
MTSMKKHTLIDCFSLRARIGWQGLRSDEFKTEGPYLVTGVDFHNGRVNWDDCYHVTEERYAQDKGIQLHEHDLLITKDGTIGKTAVVIDCPEKATLNSGVFVVRAVNNEVIPEYLHYVLHSHWFDLFVRNVLTGSTIKHLNQEKFYKFSFEAPDVQAQKKVVDVLESIDAVINKTREIIQKYTNIKSGLMQRLLQCDRKVPLSKLGTIISGSTPTTSDEKYWNGKNVWLTPADLSGMTMPFISDSERHLTDIGVKKTTGTLLPAYSVIISNRAPVGYCAVVTVPFTYNQGCKAIKCNSDVDPLYLYYFISNQKSALERVSSGTTFLELPKRELERFLVSIPLDTKEQKDIAAQILAADEKIQSEINYMNKQENVKQGLISDLLSGKVDVGTLMI